MTDDGDEAGLGLGCGLGDGAGLAQRVFGRLAGGDVAVERDEAAVRQAVAAQLDRVAVGAAALDDAEPGPPVQGGHAPRHLGVHVHRAELAGTRLGPQEILHRQAHPQHALRHAGDFGKVLIPLNQAETRVHHRHAVGHAFQRGLELRRLGVGMGLGDLELGVGRG